MVQDIGNPTLPAVVFFKSCVPIIKIAGEIAKCAALERPYKRCAAIGSIFGVILVIPQQGQGCRPIPPNVKAGLMLKRLLPVLASWVCCPLTVPYNR